MFKQAPDLREIAEVQSEALTEVSRLIEDAHWALDSALSAIDKDAAGYRKANRANPNGSDNYTPGELEEAVKEARAVLLACAPLRDLIAKREAAKAFTRQVEDAARLNSGAGKGGLSFLRALVGDRRNFRGFA